MVKSELRQLMKTKLSHLDSVKLSELSLSLSSRLNSLLENLHVIQDSQFIGAYAPIVHEPLWHLNLKQEFLDRLSFPAMTKNLAAMNFKQANLNQLTLREDFGFKILGPAEEAPEVVPAVLIIPGLAMGINGERLGRGKGFYDKYLENYRGIKIGVCFSMQLMDKDFSFPVEEHDVYLDYVVTDEKIIKCK